MRTAVVPPVSLTAEGAPAVLDTNGRAAVVSLDFSCYRSILDASAKCFVLPLARIATHVTNSLSIYRTEWSRNQRTKLCAETQNYDLGHDGFIVARGLDHMHTHYPDVPKECLRLVGCSAPDDDIVIGHVRETLSKAATPLPGFRRHSGTKWRSKTRLGLRTVLVGGQDNPIHGCLM